MARGSADRKTLKCESTLPIRIASDRRIFSLVEKPPFRTLSTNHQAWLCRGRRTQAGRRSGHIDDILLDVHESYAEINDCKYLFLTGISELGRDGLRLRVEEGRPAGETEDIRVGGSVISGGTRIDVTDDSRIFEVFWASYVAYSVLNESFALCDAAEVYEGVRLRLYSKSNFADYLSKATFACNEYPGPTQHYEVVCEDHIVDVVSVGSPLVRRLR